MRVGAVTPTRQIKCKKCGCGELLSVDIEDTKSNPILFCSNECLGSFLFEIENENQDLDYENPEEVKRFARTLMSQIGQMQEEIKVLKNVRTAYFGILKGDKLKEEDYRREWLFNNK